jgi:hypothetical protein
MQVNHPKRIGRIQTVVATIDVKGHEPLLGCYRTTKSNLIFEFKDVGGKLDIFPRSKRIPASSKMDINNWA